MGNKYQTFAELLYASYSGLQTLGFAFAKGKQRLVVNGKRGKKDEEIRKQ